MHVKIKNSKTIPIYLQKLAGHLMCLGFVLIDISPNTKSPNKNVFFFRNSPEIQEKIEDYLSKS